MGKAGVEPARLAARDPKSIIMVKNAGRPGPYETQSRILRTIRLLKGAVEPVVSHENG
jgi:hypothetical protein